MRLRPLLLLAFLSAPAWALPPVALSVGYQAEVFTSRSFDLVDNVDHLQMFRIGAGYSLPVARGLVDLEAAFSTGSTGQLAHGSVSTDLWLRGVEVGASWRYPWMRHLHPYVHLGAGWDWTTLTLIDANRLTQTVSNISGNAMLGAQVPIKLGPDDSGAPFLLLDFGLGYVFRPGAGFNAMAPTPAQTPSEDPIAHASTNLGTLQLSGIAYRILLTCRL